MNQTGPHHLGAAFLGLLLVIESRFRHEHGGKLPEDALRFDGALPSAAYLRRMEETEPIDDRWPEELSRLCRGLKEVKTLPIGARYDRMLQYILLRQLDRAGEIPLTRLIDYARDSTAFIAAQDASFGFDAEHLRRWSEQIEYSTENVDILLG